MSIPLPRKREEIDEIRKIIRELYPRSDSDVVSFFKNKLYRLLHVVIQARTGHARYSE
jgi:hypothetical protein